MVSATFHASWCEISLPRFEKNWVLAQAQAPNATRICAVLKADAYGHSIGNVVPLLMRSGVSHIDITSNDEAAAVHAAGFDGTLMRLRSTTPDGTELSLNHRGEEQVGSVANARFLADLMTRYGVRIGLHRSLNADGMSRDGPELSAPQGQHDRIWPGSAAGGRQGSCQCLAGLFQRLSAPVCRPGAGADPGAVAAGFG